MRRNDEKIPSYGDLFNLTGRVALVIGAAGGLAGETCFGLGQFGARLALADIDPARLAALGETLRDHGTDIWSGHVDVANPGSVRELVDQVSNRFGRLDVLINFAGVARPLPVEEIDTAEFERIIGINLKGAFLAAKESLRVMLPQRSGKIILVGSVSGRIGRPFSAHYSASKGGVHSMVRTIAVEVARRNIQVNAVAPVFTLTPMSEGVLNDPERSEKILSTIPMGRFGLPSDLVGAMIFLSSSASDFITGQTIMVDGGCAIS